MGVDKKGVRYCDGCGRAIQKVTRIYKGSDFCAACYRRTFVSLPCSRCHTPVRAHKNAGEPPVCKACHRASRACSRCGKAVPGKAGRVIGERVICAACAPYFGRPNPCERCGKLTTRLSKAPSLGIEERICSSCRQRLTHRTCSRCRKYRPLAELAADGAPVCAACATDPTIGHPCPVCGVAVRGSGSSRCRACVNLERLTREARLQALTLERDWAQQLLLDFSGWLYRRSGSAPNLCRKFLAHVELLQRIDATYRTENDLSPQSLLQAFGSKLLRKHLLVTQFLQSRLGLAIPTARRKAFSDRDLIDETLRDSRSSPWGPVLSGYVRWLEREPLSVRTLRMYVRVAAKLCDAEALSLSAPLSDRGLARFLSRHPGMRNNVTRFVTYGATRLGWSVAMPAKTSARSSAGARRRLERFRFLFQSIAAKGVERAAYAELTKLLSYAFVVPNHVLRERFWFLEEASDSMVLRSAEDRFKIPRPLWEFSKRWMALKKQ